MNIIHIRSDGTVAKSIEGVVIKSPEFYEVVNSILSKKERRKNGNAKAV